MKVPSCRFKSCFPHQSRTVKSFGFFHIHSLADDPATKRENWMNSNERIDGAKAETEVLNIGKYVNNGVILGFLNIIIQIIACRRNKKRA